jgi:hypothetical protein
LAIIEVQGELIQLGLQKPQTSKSNQLPAKKTPSTTPCLLSYSTVVSLAIDIGPAKTMAIEVKF